MACVVDLAIRRARIFRRALLSLLRPTSVLDMELNKRDFSSIGGALAVTLALLAPMPALAASCADLHPANGPMGYRERSAPDRCEGIYQSPVAGEILELLSFVRHPIDFDPQVDKVLKITALPLGGV